MVNGKDIAVFHEKEGTFSAGLLADEVQTLDMKHAEKNTKNHVFEKYWEWPEWLKGYKKNAFPVSLLDLFGPL